ncbi:anti-sigma factor [Chitinophaga sp. MM2321]|uniref:anti-sigma factor n=1 Tax=Chitinophaga sp. MM2321 TaxID=3137178 RepID=UPI0032D5B06B
MFGLLPESEHAEIELAVAQFPEIKAAVEALQLDKEKFVKLYALTPPPEIKDRLLDILRQEDTSAGNDLLPEELRTPPVAAQETSRMSIAGTSSSNDRVWKYLAAAIIALFLGSVILNFFFFNKSTDYKSRYKSLVATQEKLNAEKEQRLLASHQETQKELDMLKDPAFLWIKMKGAGKHDGNVVTICWNPDTQMLFLMAQLMPVAPAGKQFQLWAIRNRKLVNAGVFESGADVSQKIQKMKPLAEADAFAVTLENKGGNTVPSMDQLFMSAKVAK